jgi:sulfoxide reductase heme-binding subunit YedZ
MADQQAVQRPAPRRAEPGLQTTVRRSKPALFLICLLPLAYLAYRASTGQLSADPVEDVTAVTGQWGLRFLLITLAVTPVRQLTGWHALLRLRRMLGLFAFFYVCLHLLTYVVLDQFFAWSFIVEDIVDRPYILFGFTAFLLLIPLAATSTNAMIRRLGARRWQRLHRVVYVIGVLGVLHFFLLVKADIFEPVIYGAILAVLLGYRWSGTGSRRTAARAQETGPQGPGRDAGRGFGHKFRSSPPHGSDNMV